MANVLNRTSLEYLPSVNTPDYPEAAWIRNPDLTAVANCPKKHWKIVGDDVVEMTQAEKDAVDAAQLPGIKQAKAAALASLVTEYIEDAVGNSGTQRTLLMLYQKATDQNLINRSAHVRAAADWIESVLSDYVSLAGQIMAAADEAAVDAVTFDQAAHDATKPDPMPGVASALSILD